MTTEEQKRKLREEVLTIQAAMNAAARVGNWNDVGHLTSKLTETFGQLAILDGQTLDNTEQDRSESEIQESITKALLGRSLCEGSIMHDAGHKCAQCGQPAMLGVELCERCQ